MNTATLEDRETVDDTPDWVRDFPEWINSDMLYEIVDGEYVEKEDESAEAREIGNRICESIGDHCRVALGRARMEQLIAFPGITQCRRPDVVYVSYERWPKGHKLPRSNTWPVLPEICVEVNSPTDRIVALKQKMAEYFEAGVSQVWILTPEHELLEIYTSMTECRGYRSPAVVDCDAVIPGFKLDLAEVF